MWFMEVVWLRMFWHNNASRKTEIKQYKNAHGPLNGIDA